MAINNKYVKDKGGAKFYPITQQSAVIGLTEREYNSQNPNGLGYLVLSKDKSLSSQIVSTNTIYEVRNDFTLTSDFTVPEGSKLQINGGKITGPYTLNLNGCEVTGTNEWIGTDVTISGKTSSPAYADWFVGTDSQKITRAIEAFKCVNLNARDYYIDTPISIVDTPFSLVGQGLPGNFGTSSRTRLLANAQIDCIISITKTNTPNKYISANIERVEFNSATEELRRQVNGINFSTPGGPSRPFTIRACNFKYLNYGIYVYGSDVDHSTNLFNLSVDSCNMSLNKWAIYATGRNAIGLVDIHDSVIEQNSYGGIFADDDSHMALFGSLTVRNNLLEGQATPIEVYTAGSVIIEGNYFESVADCTVKVFGYSGVSDAPVKIFGNHHSNNGASSFTYRLSRCNIFELEDAGTVTYNVELSRCTLHKNPHNSKTKITSCNMTAFLEEDDNCANDTPVQYLPIYTNTIEDQNPTIREIAANDTYLINFTKTIAAGSYRCVFYAINPSESNVLYLRENGGGQSFDAAMLPSRSVVKYVHDITVDTPISGTNKVGFGYKNNSTGYFAASSLVMYTKGNSVPRIALKNIPCRDVTFGSLRNPSQGDILSYSPTKSIIIWDKTNNTWTNTLGYTPALQVGDTASRPDAALTPSDAGFPYFDTDLKTWLKLDVSYSNLSSTSLQANQTQKYIENPMTAGITYRIQVRQYNNQNDTISVKFCKTNDSTEDSIDVPLVKNGETGNNARANGIIECPDTTVYPYVYCQSTYSGVTSFRFDNIVKTWLTFANEVPENKSGTTTNRPDASTVGAGFTYFDTTLGELLVSNGTSWVGANGASVSSNRVLLSSDKTFAEQVTTANTVYEIQDDFTLSANFQIPAGCVLDFRGGSIDGSYTLDLNNCQVIGTNGWIGADLTIAGKTSSPCFADWFVGTDTEKITRAIQMFSVVNLNARDYTITSPIIVDKSFALIGQSLPDFFGDNGTTTYDFSATRLVAPAENTDSIITFRGYNNVYGSVLLERVSFWGTSRNADGFKSTCTGAPARPIVIRDCNFKSLSKGIAIYGSQSASRATALSTITISGCNINACGYGIYAEGVSAVVCANITGNNIEQNQNGGIYLIGETVDNLRVVNSSISIVDNMLEGQPEPIAIRAAVSLIRIIGNYLESSQVRTIQVAGNGQTRVEIKGSFCSGTASNVRYHLTNCVVVCSESPFEYDSKQYWGRFILKNGLVSLDDDNDAAVFCPLSLKENFKRVDPHLYKTALPQNKLVDGYYLNQPTYDETSSSSVSANLPIGKYTAAYVFRRKGGMTAYEGKLLSSYAQVALGSTFTKSANVLSVYNDDFIVVNFRFELTDAYSGTMYLRFYQKNFSDENFYISNIYVYSGYHNKLILPPLTKRDVGETSARPATLTADDAGYTFFDTTEGKMIVWNGTTWVNMDGTTLS